MSPATHESRRARRTFRPSLDCTRPLQECRDSIGACHHPDGILKGFFGRGAGSGAGDDELGLGEFDCACEAELLDLARPSRGVSDEPATAGVPGRLLTVMATGEAVKRRLEPVPLAEEARLPGKEVPEV